jgi:Na+-translocating ferredoxin:NAD+ oxidoreductase RnfG subunit
MNIRVNIRIKEHPSPVLQRKELKELLTTVGGCVMAILLMFADNSFAHQKVWPGRQLKETFPQATRFTSQQASISNAQAERIERTLNARLSSEDRRPTFYPAYEGDKKIGMVIFVDETGQNGIMDIGVALNNAGEIVSVKILKHRENNAITKESFLRQFIGKTTGDILKIEDEIIPQQNAVQASKAVIRAVKKSLLLMQEVFRN